MLNRMDNPKFLAVDFYCGAGGTTRGLLDAGGYVIAGIDKDEACRATYVRNNANGTLDGNAPVFLALDMFPYSPDYPDGQQDEIKDRLRELISMYRRASPDAPLLFAICAPCQSFTKFVQQRMTPERALGRERDQNLLAQTIGFVEEFKPELIISENVASIKRGQYRHIWDDFQGQLRRLGYAVGSENVCASRFGVPQYRRRSVMMAMLTQSDAGSALDLQMPQENTSALMTAADAIGHLPALSAGEVDDGVPNHRCRNVTELNQKRLMSVNPGQPNFGFADGPFGDVSLPCHRRLVAKGKRGFGDVYTRIHPGRPSPTITTRFHSISNGRFGHYEQVRGLSLREGAALQSFEDDYIFYGNNMDAIGRMIGNAVPPKLSAAMADWLLGLWADVGNAAMRR